LDLNEHFEGEPEVILRKLCIAFKDALRADDDDEL